MSAQAVSYTDPALFSQRDLERFILKSRKRAAVCRLRQDLQQADLHIRWMDILLDEWARRRTTAATRAA
jgi:hypothetical protein